MGVSKNNITRWLLISVIIVSISLLTITCSKESFLSGPAIDQRGSFLSPKGGCKASLEIKDGGFLGLTIVSKSDGRRSDTIDEVTGIIWISENKLLYSVGSIYGIPGIFVFDCKTMKKERVLGPRNPHGTDYIKLKEFSEGTVYFYYSPDVELMDYDEFRTKKYLYQINLDGTGFKKVHNK